MKANNAKNPKKNQPKDNKSLEDNANKVIELTRFNVRNNNIIINLQKINAKNAFDINVGFIESITNMLGRNEESAWQRASASLDATAKIYGYRVDSVHTETFKFLGGLNRNKKDLNAKEENDELGQDNDISKKKEKVKRGVNTLETNIRKLNLDKYDIDSEVDPLFSVMTSKFNESTARGLLLNTIPLDENINYILESKKNEDNPQSYINLNIKNKIPEENKKEEENISKANTESLKDNSSQSDLESKGIKNALNLANNLQKKEINNEESDSKVIPVKCSQDFEHIRESIKDVLRSFIGDNNIDDFIHLQLCPDLTIFRQSRHLNTEDANPSFINTFKKEINLADVNFADNDVSIINEEDQDQDNFVEMEGDEGLGDIPDENSNTDNIDNFNLNNGFNNDISSNNEINYNNSTDNFSLKINENNFTLFKYEDLIERAGHFGTGNTENLPQFINFAKNFGKLDKNSFLNKGSILGIKKEQNGRKKKEEKNFIFDEENEVDINELFNENRSKLINKGIDYRNDYDKRRKVKCFYNFDKLSQFKLFTITNKTITAKDIDMDLDINQQEKNLEENLDRNNDPDDGDWGGDEIQNDIAGFERNNDYDNFYQNEKQAEKNFGRLYRKFDIRALKKKIWTSYDDMKKEQIDFKNVVMNMSREMNEDELFSISTPTCFVCMLHLCNEKNLFIEQNNMNTFYIDRDDNGEKSEQVTKRRTDLKEKDDVSSSDASD